MCGKSEKGLKLGPHTRLELRMLKYLTSTQIDGVRFLYKNYVKGKGSIICGPRRHLFNEWIIFSLIYALAASSEKNQKTVSKKCVIVTKTEGKKLVWMKFFQNFLPDVLYPSATTITKDTYNFRTFCVTFRELSEISCHFTNEKPCLIIFDEANVLEKELDSKITKSIASKVPCVFTCDSAVPVLDDLQHFHKLLTFCGQELCYTEPFDFINQFCSRQNHEKLRDFIRSFYLEHFWQEVKGDNFPFETREVNQAIFDESNTQETTQDTDTDIFVCDTVRFVPAPLKEESAEERVKTGEDYTCNMSPLQFDSKSPESQNIYDADTQPLDPKLVNTQSVYAQEINTWSTYQEPTISDPDPDLTEDLFKDNSMELEEVSSTKEVIVISSGSTISHQQTKSSIQTRSTSPVDLFSDDDFEDVQVEPVMKPEVAILENSPPPPSLPVIKALERCHTKISTPIAQLVSGKAFQDSESPIGFLSPNFWNDTKEGPTKGVEDSVFEITKNDVFCNVLRVNENNEISPVGHKPQRPLPKFDWSAFTEGASVQESPETSKKSEASPNKSTETSPSKSYHSSQLHTPTSKRTTTPCSRSSSKKVFKSGGGWLNKYSPVVPPKTPMSNKSRRKKLETLFNDIATPVPEEQGHGQDMLMSPNDLFE